MGAADFRIGGRIFATLAAEALGLGMVQLPREQQEMVVEADPERFRPVPGGWGRMGCTHVVLAAADEATLTSALTMAFEARVAKNAGTRRKRR